MLLCSGSYIQVEKLRQKIESTQWIKDAWGPHRGVELVWLAPSSSWLWETTHICVPWTRAKSLPPPQSSPPEGSHMTISYNEFITMSQPTPKTKFLHVIINLKGRIQNVFIYYILCGLGFSLDSNRHRPRHCRVLWSGKHKQEDQRKKKARLSQGQRGSCPHSCSRWLRKYSSLFRYFYFRICCMVHDPAQIWCLPLENVCVLHSEAVLQDGWAGSPSVLLNSPQGPKVLNELSVL